MRIWKILVCPTQTDPYVHRRQRLDPEGPDPRNSRAQCPKWLLDPSDPLWFGRPGWFSIFRPVGRTVFRGRFPFHGLKNQRLQSLNPNHPCKAPNQGLCVNPKSDICNKCPFGFPLNRAQNGTRNTKNDKSGVSSYRVPAC